MSKYVLDDYRNLIEAYSKAEINEIRKGKVITLSKHNWSGLTQTVSLPEISVNDNPVVDIKTSNDHTTAVLELWEWTKILKAETQDGFIKFYAASVPTMDLQVLVNGVTLDAQDIPFLPISTLDRTSYEGKVYPTLKEKDDADIDFVLSKINGTRTVQEQNTIIETYNNKINELSAEVLRLKLINNITVQYCYNDILNYYQNGYWSQEDVQMALDKKAINEVEYNMIITSKGV